MKRVLTALALALALAGCSDDSSSSDALAPTPTATASATRAPSIRSNASRGAVPASMTTAGGRITWPAWANLSTSRQSSSVTIPTGRDSTTTTAARWARLGISESASATVWSGRSWMGVSKTRCRDFTWDTTSATTGAGMSWGSTVNAPRRATVSAIRLPAIAVMFATTSGRVAPVPSRVVRSTS